MRVSMHRVESEIWNCAVQLNNRKRCLTNIYIRSCVVHMNSEYVFLSLQKLPKFVKNKFKWQMWLRTILARAQCFQTGFKFFSTHVLGCMIPVSTRRHELKRFIRLGEKARENMIMSTYFCVTCLAFFEWKRLGSIVWQRFTIMLQFYSVS